MPFEAIDQVFDPTLKLPGIGGRKIYSVPEGDGEFGLWCARMMAGLQRVANGEEGAELPPLRFEGAEETAMQRRALGDALYDEMVADGLGPKSISFVTETVVIWHAMGKEMAELYWASGGDGEAFQRAALQRFRQQQRAATSGNGGAASTTKRRGSTNGTRSRKAS